MNNPAFIAYKHMAQSEIVWSFPAQTSGKRVPPGLTISAAGLITGTPTESGTFEFDVQAVQKSNSKVKAVATYRMAIDLLPLTLELADGALPDAESGKPYSFDFKPLLAFKNLPEASIVWAKSNVDQNRPLPSGLTLNKNVLSGTPTGADEYEFKVKVSYSNSSPQAERIDAERTYRLYVKKAAPYFTSNIANVTSAIGKPITVTPKVGNKHADDVYSLVGSYPKGLFYEGGPVDPDDKFPGLMFDKKTGEISGTTKVSGEFSVQIKVTDKLDQSAVSNTFTLKFLDNVPSFVGEFNDKVGIEPDVSNILSNPILVYGNATAAPTTLTFSEGTTGVFRVCTSIAEAQGGVCNGTRVTTANITSGTYVQILLNSAITFDTPVTATLDVGGITRTFSVITRKTDTTPKNFGEFTPIGNAEFGRSYASNIIKIDGITDKAKAKLEIVEGLGSTSDASVSLCMNGFDNSNECISGTRGARQSYANGTEFMVSNNSYLQLQVRSSADFNSAATVRLTVGGVARDFRVTTRKSDTTPKDLGEFAPITGAELNATYASNVIKVEGITDDATVMLVAVEGLSTNSNATVYLCSGNFTTSCTITGRGTSKATATGSTFTVPNGSYLQLLVRSSTAFATPATVRLTVGDVERDFSVTTKAAAADLGGDTEFWNAMDVERSTSVASNATLIKGLTAATTATIAVVEGAGTVNAYVCKDAASAANRNCFYSSSYYKSQITTTAGKSVSNGDYVQFVLTSSANSDTPTTVKLTVNGVDRFWTVRTRKTVTTPTNLGGFGSLTDAPLNKLVASDVIQITGITDPTTATLEVIGSKIDGNNDILYVCSSVAYVAGKNCFHSSLNWRVRVVNGQSISVRPGEYIQLGALSENAFDAEKVLKVKIGDVERIWNVRTRKTVTAPVNLDEFEGVANAERSMDISSNIIRVNGITDTVQMTSEIIEGVTAANVTFYVCDSPTYAMRGDCWSSVLNYSSRSTHAGGSINVKPGEYVQVRIRSNADYDSATRVKFKIGDAERVFEVMTRSMDITPENLGTFQNVTGAALNATVTSEAVLVMDIKDPAPITVSVIGSANATTKVFTCLPVRANGGSCASLPITSGTAGGPAITITDGNYIALQTKAAATADTEVRVTVTVGGVSRTWSVRTAP